MKKCNNKNNIFHDALKGVTVTAGEDVVLYYY
jgi:hypothetical protein